jgi:photosystem II stability/assembly factor-like uncharacterized protein
VTRGTIIESRDDGKTWTYDSSLVVQEKEELNSVGLAITDQEKIVAVTKGIFKKSRSGSSWANIGTSLPYRDVNLLFHPGGNHLIIQTLTDGKFYYSGNFGASWEYFGQGLPVFYYDGIESTERCYNIVKRDKYLYITTGDGFFKRQVED